MSTEASVKRTEPSPHRLPPDAGLGQIAQAIRGHLATLVVLPLDEDDLGELCAVAEWLADMAWSYREAAVHA